jgi:hypothetical protein
LDSIKKVPLKTGVANVSVRAFEKTSVALYQNAVGATILAAAKSSSSSAAAVITSHRSKERRVDSMIPSSGCHIRPNQNLEIKTIFAL